MKKPTKRKVEKRPPGRLDPWADPPPIVPHRPDGLKRYGLRCDPDDPLGLWECECQRQHVYSYYFQGPPGNPKGHGKTFWERIQSCDLLKNLARKHQAELLHPVFFLLREIHDYGLRLENDAGPNPRQERRQIRREAAGVLRRLRGAMKTLGAMPDWALPEGERSVVLSFLEGAEARAKEMAEYGGPKELRIVFSDPAKNVILPLEKPTLKRGRPREGAEVLNGDLFLLSESVRALVGESRYWPVAADLVRHFCPTRFDSTFDAEHLRPRVNEFKRKYRGGQFEDLRQGLQNRLSYLLKQHTEPPPPGK